MKSAPLAAVCLGLLLSCTCWAKPNGPKGKKPKQVIPAIECDVRAGKINLPEFIAKCPAHCKETKQQVYGSGVFASISSICNAAIHSGVITNAGGKVIVKKMAGQNIYKGSSSNGVRSLSLPKWRESFVVTVGKPKKGVIYPATLDYVPSRPTYVKTSQKEAKSPPVTTELPTAAAPEPTTTTTPQPSSTSSTTLAPSTPPPTTPPPSTPPPATTKARAAVHKVRDAGNGHPYLASEPSASSRQQPHNGPGGSGPVFRGATYLNRFAQRTSAGQRRPEPGATIRRQPSSPAGPVPRAPDSDGGRKVPLDTTYTRVEPVDSWRPDASIYESGYNVREEEPAARVPEPAPQGAPECKVDLVFLMDGSWSIGKRRFKIQKDFLSEVAQTINVGVTGPVMGVVQYGDEPVTEVSLKSASSSRELRSAIEKITQKGGPSHVGKALGYINKQFFSDANGNRGGAPNVAVVLVDGWPTDKVEEASRLARESGINIFFVTIEGADDVEKKNLIENDFVDKAVCRTNGFFSLPVSSWFALRKLVQPLVKRVCDADRLVCSKTCLNANDIAFVIDGSSSVGTGNFRTVLQFVANITREFEISDTDTRVGAVQYTYEQRLEFSFTQHGNKAELLNAIKRINYWSGGTSTGAAISYAAEQLFSKSKPNKRKIMIVITDGRSYDDVRQPALAVHRQDVIAYAVGIAWASQDELEYIATDPDKEHAFFVDEFDNLYKFVPKIVDNICQEFNSQPRN
ncbi:vitrin isoform X10 [Takifugu flavidus]|uniref:vitrin isoform X10 n=1 Tax=Takifugu flavidus TaxID=433684 RepID=UPI00254406D5|nr:vitrin isoform X10 [Takifugu flavidus]